MRIARRHQRQAVSCRLGHGARRRISRSRVAAFGDGALQLKAGCWPSVPQALIAGPRPWIKRQRANSFACIAGHWPVAAQHAQISNLSNCRPNLARDVPPATELSPLSSAQSPAAASRKRLARPQTDHQRHSNPHSARGTLTRPSSAVSSLGGFPTPAASAPGNAQSRPVFTNSVIRRCRLNVRFARKRTWLGVLGICAGAAAVTPRRNDIRLASRTRPDTTSATDGRRRSPMASARLHVAHIHRRRGDGGDIAVRLEANAYGVRPVGITSPAAMLGVIVGLVIVGAAALHARFAGRPFSR